VVRSFPELTILVKGIIYASRSVSFTFILLTLIIYVFAICLRQMSRDTDIGKQYFDTVPSAMRTLLLRGTLPDHGEFMFDVTGQDMFLGFVVLLFIILGFLTILNMLVGVLVGVVEAVSACEKEQILVSNVKYKLLAMLDNSGLDADEDMHISRTEFMQLLLRADAAKVIQDVGVDVVGLVDFTDFIFSQADPVDGLSFPDFINVVLKFRGTNTATVRDIVDLRKMMMRAEKNQEDTKNLIQRHIMTPAVLEKKGNDMRARPNMPNHQMRRADDYRANHSMPNLHQGSQSSLRQGSPPPMTRDLRSAGLDHEKDLYIGPGSSNSDERRRRPQQQSATFDDLDQHMMELRDINSSPAHNLGSISPRTDDSDIC